MGCGMPVLCGASVVWEMPTLWRMFVAWRDPQDMGGPRCMEVAAECGAPTGCEVPTERVASTVHEIPEVFGIAVMRGVATVHWMVAGCVGCS